MSRPRVETSEYRFSHGRGPRGRGSWLFTFGECLPAAARTASFMAFGTFTEARAKAVAAAAAAGHSVVRVCP